MTETLFFRKMTLDDLDRIMVIEHESFSLPWSRNAFVAELTQNHFANYLVALYNEEVVGYAGVWVILDEGHVTNIAIHPSARGKKLGEKLMLELVATAIALGAERMTLEVRVSNEVAKRLYEKLGFVSHGIRKGYYTDNNEDAIIMWAEFDADRSSHGLE